MLGCIEVCDTCAGRPNLFLLNKKNRTDKKKKKNKQRDRSEVCLLYSVVHVMQLLERTVEYKSLITRLLFLQIGCCACVFLILQIGYCACVFQITLSPSFCVCS